MAQLLTHVGGASHVESFPGSHRASLQGRCRQQGHSLHYDTFGQLDTRTWARGIACGIRTVNIQEYVRHSALFALIHRSNLLRLIALTREPHRFTLE
jgi:hypothetical protein